MPDSRVTGLGNCGFYDTQFIKDLVVELRNKAYIVRSGLDEFTKAETLAYMILLDQGLFDE